MTTAMFLKVEGASGECKDKAHAEWIDIYSLSWGVSQAGIMFAGGGGGAGKANFQDLTVSAPMDKATSAILKNCATGKHLGEVKVSMCKAGGTQVEYCTIVLKDVLVTSVSLGGSSEVPTVTYTFTAAKVEHHYWQQTEKGAQGAEVQMGWDIKENVATA